MAFACFSLGNVTGVRQHAAILAGILAQSGAHEAAPLLEKCIDNPTAMLYYHLICWQTEVAIDCYEQGIERRYPLAPLLAFAVPFRFLRGSPRWAKLAKMMNLPEKVS